MSVRTPRKLFAGQLDGEPGIYWAWPFDGYWDLHWTSLGEGSPDGSDVIEECLPTLAAAKDAAREWSTQWNAVLSSALRKHTRRQA